MADDLIELYEELLQIRKYLIKKGQSRYKGSVSSDKLQEAEILLNKSKTLFFSLSDISKESEIELINATYKKICALFQEISKLCNVSSVELKSETMEFDMKTACMLIPILDDKENTTKRLIDAVEMYADMLSDVGQQLLIKFILKGRLSENAKLRVADTYSTISDMIKDFRNKLLIKKSFTAVQNQIQSLNQGYRTIEEYGSELERLLTDLNISQAEGDTAKCAILKPINEKMAVKKFTDGLKSERLSTIIAARNYIFLKDAIQAAKDESPPSSSSSRPAEVMEMTSTFRGRNNYYFRKPSRQNRGHSRQNFQKNNRGNFQNNFNNYGYHSNRYQGHSRPFRYAPRGRGQHNRQGYYYNRRGGQGFYKVTIPPQSDNTQTRTTNSLEQKPDKIGNNQFFRD